MKRGKKAQETFGLSFSMIFAIFLIAASAFVAFYVINHFLNLNKCTQVGFFYTDLGDRVNDLWLSDKGEFTFTGEIPSAGIFRTKITYACLGNLTQQYLRNNDRIKQEELMRKGLPLRHNAFLYPSSAACDDLASNVIPHLTIDKFFCTNVTNGKVYIKLFKLSPGSPVMASP
jgi:hypothetical protein